MIEILRDYYTSLVLVMIICSSYSCVSYSAGRWQCGGIFWEVRGRGTGNEFVIHKDSICIKNYCYDFFYQHNVFLGVEDITVNLNGGLN